MKERPIIFNAPMVRALRDGSKTQTRRVVKPAPEADQKLSTVTGSSGFIYAVDSTPSRLWPDVRRMRWDCPYGQPGDHLWVRETFYCDESTYPNGAEVSVHWREVEGKRMPIPMEEQRARMLESMYYRADGEPEWEAAEGNTPWRPSIHMPRWASRITLEITDVRVERLQYISESDAIAEGCSKNHNGYYWGGPHAVSGLKQMATAKSAYNDLWTSINGPDSWAANPWVWVIEFKTIAGGGV